MTAEIINIGDELLNGYIINTNASWIGLELEKNGVSLKRTTVVSDKASAIIEALEMSMGSSESLFIFTGGLGPTNDDITKSVVSSFFNAPLEMNREVLNHIQSFFKLKGIPMAKVNEGQALVPKGATALTNNYGTAPGLKIEKKGKTFFFFPGVPYELKHLFNNYVIPHISSLALANIIVTKQIITRGIGESSLSEKIVEWEAELRKKGYGLAYLPNQGSVTLRITKNGSDKVLLNKEIDSFFKILKTLIPEYIPDIQSNKSEEYLGELLKKNSKTISIAESCTGGYLSHCLSKIPGCSSYFMGSIVTYSNESKIQLLDVSKEIIKINGAVSCFVVEEMANNARLRFNTNYSIAISGIAGPSGGSKQKPVGLVWLGFSSKEKTISKKINLKKNRLVNIELASQYAMRTLISLIEQESF